MHHQQLALNVIVTDYLGEVWILQGHHIRGYFLSAMTFLEQVHLLSSAVIYTLIGKKKIALGCIRTVQQYCSQHVSLYVIT